MSLFDTMAPGVVAGFQRDLGYTLFQACGEVGNIGWECGGFEQLHQGGGGPAIGWKQWEGPRQKKFLRWCDAQRLDWHSAQANYYYCVIESLTDERAALLAVKATKTLKDATDVFEARDERAGAPALPGREHYAQRALAAYNSLPQPVAPIFPPFPPFQGPLILPSGAVVGLTPAPKSTVPAPSVAPHVATGAGTAVAAIGIATHVGWSSTTVMIVGVLALVAGIALVEIIQHVRSKK